MANKRYSIEPGPYCRAVELMRALRAEGIDCGEDVGCVAIYPTEAQTETMVRICQEVIGIQPSRGSDSLLKSLITERLDAEAPDSK